MTVDDERMEMLERISSKDVSYEQFNYDSLIAPPLLTFFTYTDIMDLHKIATSIKYTDKPLVKKQMMDQIVGRRGWVRLAEGTNRMCYRFLEDPRYVIKVAHCNVGCTDSPNEYRLQEYFKPFVSKIFEVDPTGTVSLAERVEPIRNREEFASIAELIYDLLRYWFVGKYILDDVGTNTPLNWGISLILNRGTVMPLLLDFPYAYEVDGNKLYCNKPDPITGQPCGGEIDYDDGFNYLHCTKCGAHYYARELAKATKDNLIIKKEVGNNMKIVIRRGDTIIKEVDNTKNSDVVMSKWGKRAAQLKKPGEGMVVTNTYKKYGIKQVLPGTESEESNISSNEEDNKKDVIPNNAEESSEENNTEDSNVEEATSNDYQATPDYDDTTDSEVSSEGETLDDAENNMPLREVEEQYDTDSKFIPKQDEDDGEDFDEKYPVDESTGAQPPKYNKKDKRNRNKRSKKYDPDFYKDF